MRTVQHATDTLGCMLTPREHEIATIATAGLRNREIARRLHLTEGTVKSHLHNIYQKAGIKNWTTLTARFHGRPSANGHAPNFVDAQPVNPGDAIKRVRA